MLPSAIKKYLEESLHSELTGFKQELRNSHLRAIRLESQLRDNRNQIGRLNIELNQSRENEQGLSETVQRLTEKTIELEEKYLAQNSENIKEFKFKTDNLEAVLALCWDEIGVLRTDLEAERKGKVEVERRMAEIFSQFEKVMGELKFKNGRLEQRIAEVEKGMVTQSSSENGVVAVIDQLASDFRENFEQWNKKQIGLEEEFGKMGDVIEELRRGKDVQVPPNNAPVPSTPSTSTAWINTLIGGPDFTPNGQEVTTPTPVTLSKWDLPHGEDHSDPLGLRCTCGSQYKSKAGLTEHIQYYTQEWKFPCTLCLKRFWEYNKLSKHMGAAHGITLPGGRHGCRTCGLIVTSREAIVSHRKFCYGRGQRKTIEPEPEPAPLKLKIVNGKAIQIPAAGKRKQNLKRILPRKINNVQHRRDFTFQREFACHCGKKFRDGRGLTRHLKYHTIRKFSCKHCSQRFAFACYLRDHLLRQHKHQMTSNSQSQLQSQTKHHSFLLHSLRN